MPIYEYECENCGVFEATQKITRKALSRCPTCKAKVKRLISNTSFQLKGSGWYITDYARKEKTPKDGKAEKGSAGEAKGDGKAEKAPAAEAKGDGKAKDAGDGSAAEKKPAKPAAAASSTD